MAPGSLPGIPKGMSCASSHMPWSGGRIQMHFNLLTETGLHERARSSRCANLACAKFRAEVNQPAAHPWHAPFGLRTGKCHPNCIPLLFFPFASGHTRGKAQDTCPSLAQLSGRLGRPINVVVAPLSVNVRQVDLPHARGVASQGLGKQQATDRARAPL